MLTELARREKEAGIKPDPDIDVYMKVRKAELCFKPVVCYKFSFNLRMSSITCSCGLN